MASFNALSNQMKHRDREMVPKFLVVAMFALMGASLLMVATARFTGREATSVVAHSDIQKELSVILKGSRSEGVGVYDVSGTQLAHSTDHKKGFIDVIWVAVTRERLVQDVPSDAPVRVVLRENGNVGILDDTTGWKIELIGYGKDNVAAFAKLLD
jgi:putative photosynthetic complex assembly protein